MNVGAADTVKAEAVVTKPESRFVSVRLRAETVAVGDNVTYALASVALAYTVESTVMPVPENVALMLSAKFVPTIVRT